MSHGFFKVKANSSIKGKLSDVEGILTDIHRKLYLKPSKISDIIWKSQNS